MDDDHVLVIVIRGHELWGVEVELEQACKGVEPADLVSKRDRFRLNVERITLLNVLNFYNGVLLKLALSGCDLESVRQGSHLHLFGPIDDDLTLARDRGDRWLWFFCYLFVISLFTTESAFISLVYDDLGGVSVL